MSELFPQHWFLELDGKRMGPFSPEQILGLLADGEIPEGLLVFPVNEAGQEDRSGGMTAAAMREAYFRDDRIPAADPSWADSSGPLEIGAAAARVVRSGPEWDSSPSIPVAREDVDLEAAANLATARRLFDLFQSARERRAKFSPPSTDEMTKLVDQDSSPFSWLRNPVAAAAAASVIVITGVRYIGNSAGVSDDAQRELAQSKSAVVPETREPAPPPVRPAAPARPVAKLQNTWKPSVRPAAPSPAADSRDTETVAAAPAPRPFVRPGVRPMQKPFRAGMPQPPQGQPQQEQDWAAEPPQDANMANDGSRAPEAPDANPLNNVVSDAGLAPGQMPPEQPFQDPNANPDGQQQPPPEQPQDTYRVE
jgi:hypothetical protein